MSPQTAISNHTDFIFFPQQILCKSFALPPSQIIFPGKHFPEKIISSENRSLRHSRMSIKTRIYKVKNEDESLMGFEQESFIDKSAEYRSTVGATSLVSLLNRSSKWAVSIVLAVAIIWRHDAKGMWAAFGCILNAGLSNLLKRLLNHQRPQSASKSDPGMPSSHAQSLFFTAIFVYVSIVEFLGTNSLTTMMAGLIYFIAFYLSWIRVSQRFHTFSQVAVGAIVGSAFATLWFWSWNSIILNAFLSHLWVRIVVTSGAAGYSVAFAVYIIRYWVMEDIVNFINSQIKNPL